MPMPKMTEEAWNQWHRENPPPDQTVGGANDDLFRMISKIDDLREADPVLLRIMYTIAEHYVRVLSSPLTPAFMFLIGMNAEKLMVIFMYQFYEMVKVQVEVAELHGMVNVE